MFKHSYSLSLLPKSLSINSWTYTFPISFHSVLGFLVPLADRYLLNFVYPSEWRCASASVCFPRSAVYYFCCPAASLYVKALYYLNSATLWLLSMAQVLLLFYNVSQWLTKPFSLHGTHGALLLQFIAFLLLVLLFLVYASL